MKRLFIILFLFTANLYAQHMILHEQSIDLTSGWGTCGSSAVKLDTLYEEQDKDKIGLIYLYKNDTLSSVDASIRKSYYNLYGFNHRYDGQNEIYEPYQMYLSYLYQKWPETSGWGKYYPENSYAKPKIVNFIINTKLRNDGSASVRIDYEILEEINDTDIVLHVALIEDGIPNTFESGALGEKMPVCNNILRKMAPDGNGTLLGAFEVGDTGSAQMSFDKNRGEVSNYDNTRLIVYFQSRDNFKIYETARLDQHPFQDHGTWEQTALHNKNDNIFKLGIKFSANNKTISLSRSMEGCASLKVFNMSGREICSLNLIGGHKKIKIPELTKGVYAITIVGKNIKISNKIISQ